MFPKPRYCHRVPLPLTLLLLLAGCSEGPTEPAPAELAATHPRGLDFTFASFSPALLVDYENVSLGPSEPGPAPTEAWGDPEMSSIRNARTITALAAGAAIATGSHRYTGNIGRIETTVEVAFRGQHLGSRTGVKQQSEVFLLDFGLEKYIYVQARVFTDKQCGLEIHGHSTHEAWWEFYQGVGVPVWGRDARPSQADPTRSAPCGSRTDTEDPRGGAGHDSGGRTCTYRITYDLDTGEIYDVTLLYCSSGTLF